MVGVILGIRKVEYEFRMISSRAAGGISAGEIYKLKTRNARSSKDRFSHSSCQFGGKDGISSGMNKPLSGASPLRTASSKENCSTLAFRIGLLGRRIYAIRPSARAEIFLRRGM